MDSLLNPKSRTHTHKSKTQQILHVLRLIIVRFSQNAQKDKSETMMNSFKIVIHQVIIIISDKTHIPVSLMCPSLSKRILKEIQIEFSYENVQCIGLVKVGLLETS